MGATLEQFNNNRWKPLGFYSKKFSSAQQRYSTYDRELQAIFSGLKFFQHLVEGRKVLIKTDHKPLIYVFKQKSEKASPRQLRQSILSVNWLHIVHVLCADNIIADTLSRINSINMFITVSAEELISAQKKDTELPDLLSSPGALNLRRIRIDDTESSYIVIYPPKRSVPTFLEVCVNAYLIWRMDFRTPVVEPQRRPFKGNSSGRPRQRTSRSGLVLVYPVSEVK